MPCPCPKRAQRAGGAGQPVPHLSRMQFSSMPLFLLSYSSRALLVGSGSSGRSCQGGRGISSMSFPESLGESPRYPRWAHGGTGRRRAHRGSEQSLPAAWRGPKLPWKVLHGALALTAFGLTVVGLVAVFGFHNASKTPNMYSLHSWLGLATVLLFSCQWLAGFSAFLLPYSPPWLRALYKPVHVFFGCTILMLSVASCVSGINEKLFFSLKNGTATTPYNRLPPEAVFANVLGLLIVLFGVLVLCALAKPDWKRPEDDSTDTRQVGTRSAAGLRIGSQGGSEEPSRGSASHHGPSWSVPGVGWAGERRLQAHPRLPAAPARHRALTPPRSVPAVPGLPARSSPTPLLSRLPRRLAFAGLPVPNALLLVGRTGSAALQQRCRCGGDVSLPPLWPSTGLLPASGQEQLQRRAPACVLVPLPASSCGVQLSPRAWTVICAKSAAPEPCGAISGTSSGWKPPEEHPVTGGAGTQHSVGCPSPVSSTGTAGALAPCLTLCGDVCVVVGPAQQPSGTPNKMLASAALLHLCPLGQPRPVLMFSLFWVCCVVPPAPRCRASSAPALKFLFCPPPGASSRPRECSHVSLMVSPPSHGAEMRARG
uniref:Lysosomal membrane ascorbate-dependent ferrireductase CYB561A3 n=1 Tax=Anser brachyrhynchus TaxID=132585 RepID=A0A8B9CWN1_9AVES